MMSWKEYKLRAKAGSSVATQLDQMGTQGDHSEQGYVKALMEALLFGAQQGIAFQGHNESEDLLNPGNFKALMAILFQHSEPVSVRFLETVKVQCDFLHPFKKKLFTSSRFRFVA